MKYLDLLKLLYNKINTRLASEVFPKYEIPRFKYYSDTENPNRRYIVPEIRQYFRNLPKEFKKKYPII